MYPEHRIRLSVRTAGDGPVAAGWKETYSFIMLGGRTFRANSQNGIIAVCIAQGNQDSVERRGELVELFLHSHRHGSETFEVYFAKVRWYINVTTDGTDSRPNMLWCFDAYV